jgi:myosin heavy subunit
MQNVLQGQLKDQIQRARDLEDQLQQRTLLKSKIQEQLSTQVSQSRKLEEQLQQHSNEQRILQHEFDGQVEKCKELEQQLKQKCEENDDLQIKLDRLMLELEKCQQQSAVLMGSEADARAMPGMEVLALANDASPTDDQLQELQNEHMQLKANLLDQVEQCNFLHKQVNQHKHLQAKQQERNKILLKTNQTLTEMIDDRQQRCGELETSVANLSHQLEKYQRRQSEEATKLEELRRLRREKQEIAQQLISSQTWQSHVEQETLSKMASDLQEQQSLVASLRDETERVKKDYSERMEQMQLQYQKELKKKEEFNGIGRNRGFPPPLLDTSALAGKDVIEALSFDPLITTAEETKKKGSDGVLDLNDMLSCEVSFLFGLPSPTKVNERTV